MKFFKRRREDGQILVTLIIVVPSLILMISAYLILSTSNYRLSRTDQFHTMSQAAADSGADYAIAQINQDANYTGSSETTLHSDSTVKTTFTTSLASVDANNKTLSVTGKTYWPATAATPTTSVNIKVQLRAAAQGNYSIITGQGGLVMSNSAKIVAGDIFINGTISMSNQSQIGLTTNPVNVNVADDSCPVPADANYPRLCNNGEGATPIAVNGTQAWIYGNVKANNQPNGNRMSNPGLTSTSGVSTQDLPAYDRAAQKAAVQTTITGASASCTSTNGTKTWTANTKITGDVSITNNCKVTVQGNVWITGNLTASNTGQMIVADSLGATTPVIMVDGSSGAIFKNSFLMQSNSVNTGFKVITYWANSACSPDCSTLTGTALANSQAVTTISLINSASAPQSIFYAYWSQVNIGNTGQIGALVGQTINMNNSSTITFGSTAQSGSVYWIANGYRRAFP
jgi:hypothetical protein